MDELESFYVRTNFKPQMLFYQEQTDKKISQTKIKVTRIEEDKERKMIHFFCVNLFLGRGGGQGLKQRQTEPD